MSALSGWADPATGGREENGSCSGYPPKAYRENGQLEKALESAQRSARLDPLSPDTQYLLGQLYRDNDQVDLAQQELELFQKYKRANP
jgi:hypothetical protein